MSFIFQAKSGRYDLRNRLIPQNKTNWTASRYRSEMRKGVVVYFWQAGKETERGIYGWGTITEDKPAVDYKGIYRIQIVYERNFLEHPKHEHISVPELKQYTILKNLQIMRLAIGTNFLLTEEEELAIKEVIRKKYGDDWVPHTKSDGGMQ